MKYGMKIFITTFILVICSIYIIGTLMIYNNYKTDMNNQIDKNLFQINNIYNNFNLYNNSEKLSAVANLYVKDKTYIKIYSNNELLFSNINDIPSDIEKNLLVNNENKLKTFISEKKIYTGLVYNNIKILTVNDITNIYDSIEKQRKFFFALSIIFSIGIAFILYIIITVLTRKITALNNIASEIEKGNYSIKVKAFGNDEIGKLAKTFNSMSDSIEYNVNKIKKIANDREIFINNLTHEIRTPLTSIIGFSSLLINTSNFDKNKMNEYLNKIHEEGIYIKNITDKLIELILLNQQGKLKKQNLSEVLTNIVKEVKDIFPDVRIETNICENIFATFDATLLKSLVFNLVKNSIVAYREEDCKYIKVILKPKYIQIIDKGKGIPEEDIEKIKQPFYTINQDRNRDISGMGLGIPLCNKIVDFFQWSLSISSKVNVGTEITINMN